MHSSRMRTGRMLASASRGGVSAPGGVCLPGGVWSGGVPALGGACFGGACSRRGCLLFGGAWWRPPPDGYCCGQYASYWNAFLYLTPCTFQRKNYQKNRLTPLPFELYPPRLGNPGSATVVSSEWIAVFSKIYSIKRSFSSTSNGDVTKVSMQ